MIGNTPINTYDKYGLWPPWFIGIAGGCTVGIAGSVIGSWMGGDSFDNGSCKAGFGCAAGAAAGLVSTMIPQFTGCAAGIATAAASALGYSYCDKKCGGNPNKPNTCYVADAIASAVAGCAIGTIPAGEIGGEVIQSMIALLYSAVGGSIAGDVCDLGNGVFYNVR